MLIRDCEGMRTPTALDCEFTICIRQLREAAVESEDDEI